jgi:hypothetical protein
MECSAVKSGRNSPTFRRNERPASSSRKFKLSKWPARSRQQAKFPAAKFLGSLFDPDDEGNMFLRNVSELLPKYTTLHQEDSILYIHCCEIVKSDTIILLSITTFSKNFPSRASILFELSYRQAFLHCCQLFKLVHKVDLIKKNAVA